MTVPAHLLDMGEVAEWLATSRRHVQRLVTEKRIRYVKVGHFIRFDPQDVISWIDEQKVEQRSDTRLPPATIGQERRIAPTAPRSRRPTSAAEVLARWQNRAR